METINPQLLREIRENPKVRRRVAYESPLWFSIHYLRHHFSYPLAPFHIELFHILTQPEYSFVAVMAFRESGKSTIMNTANVLWSILGKPQKKFVIIVSKTQEQAKNHFANIKTELMTNELLKEDFGPFMETKEEWNKLSLELEYHGAKILSVTNEQSVRGLKYGQFRPDLIICDDLEDITSGTRQNESETLKRWFASEIVPLGSLNTRIIVLGNLLSRDSFLMRLKDDIAEKRQTGLFRAYPLLDSEEKVLWRGKFPDQENIEKLLQNLSRETWTREYLLDLSGNGGRNSSHNYDLSDPIDRLGYEIDLKAREAYRAYRANLVSAGDITLQNPLIPAMREFHIEVPSHKHNPDPGDRGYTRYQRYEEERIALGREYDDKLWEIYREKI